MAYLAVVEFCAIQATQPKGIAKGRKRKDASNISRVESIERASPRDSDKKIEKTKIENLLRVGLCFAADPDARTSRHALYIKSLV